MSSSNLTRVEASQRAQAVEVLSELIEIDVTGAPSKDTHFPVDATLELAVKDAGTKLWIDFPNASQADNTIIPLNNML